MKKVIIITLLLNLACSTRAQVVSRYNNPDYAQTTNAYYKDLNNFQNQFEGTWVFQNGLERLEIKFRKKEMILSRPGPHQYYHDVLVGEYKYIDANGVEKVNSLANFSQEHPSEEDYILSSGPKVNNNFYPQCNDCPAGTERLYIFFDEPSNDDLGIDAAFVIRHFVENGVEKIKAVFEHRASASNENKLDASQPSVFREFSLPYGTYILSKQ